MDISVVIPLYNGKDKVWKCITQLDGQTFQGDFEVLIVDDASPDGSGKLMAEKIHRLRYPERFRVILCKDNGRAGRARNIGIKEALGEYVLFIDQDDYPDLTMLDELYKLTDDGEYDITYCNVQECNGQIYRRPKIIGNPIDSSQRQKGLTSFGYVFGMLYKRKVLLSNKLFFPENVMFEDVLWHIGTFSCFSSFNCTEKVLYFRIGDAESQTAYLDSQKLHHRIKATKMYLDVYKNNEYVIKNWEMARQLAIYYIFTSCTWWIVHDRKMYSEKLWTEIIDYGYKSSLTYEEIMESINRANLPAKANKILPLCYLKPKSIYLFLGYFTLINFVRKLLSPIKKIVKKMMICKGE